VRSSIVYATVYMLTAARSGMKRSPSTSTSRDAIMADFSASIRPKLDFRTLDICARLKEGRICKVSRAESPGV
jgi:hypothetical protein